MQVVWVTRKEGEPYDVQDGDLLPQREKLYKLGNSLAASKEVVSFYRERQFRRECQRKKRALHILDTSVVLV